jgi:ArsR family transcriptional regulator
MLRRGDLLLSVLFVELIQIYQCLCDQTRLRILHLLTKGPLCVCHLQEILNEPQVKISKHLAYLRTKGMVQAKRRGNWMIYSLPARGTAELETNMKCLQDCAQSQPEFKRDLRKLATARFRCAPPERVVKPNNKATR